MVCTYFPNLLFGTVSHPAGDAPAQDAIDGAGANVPEHLQSELKVSKPPKEAEIGNTALKPALSHFFFLPAFTWEWVLWRRKLGVC